MRVSATQRSIPRPRRAARLSSGVRSSSQRDSASASRFVAHPVFKVPAARGAALTACTCDSHSPAGCKSGRPARSVVRAPGACSAGGDSSGSAQEHPPRAMIRPAPPETTQLRWVLHCVPPLRVSQSGLATGSPLERALPGSYAQSGPWNLASALASVLSLTPPFLRYVGLGPRLVSGEVELNRSGPSRHPSGACC